MTQHIYRCDNCGHSDSPDALPDAKNILSRVSPGDIYTDKECPKCGALAFPVDQVANAG